MSEVAAPTVALLSALLTVQVSVWLIARSPAALRILPSGNNPCHDKGAKLIAGGVPVWIALAACAVTLPTSWPIGFVLLMSFCLSIVGFLDDCWPFSVTKKLLAQSPLFVLGLFALPRFLLSAPFGLSLVFAFVALVVVTNAMNVVDVADGLAPGVGTVTLSGVALLMFQHGQFELARLALTFACTMAAFLCFNAPPGRLVLGDTGSLVLGGLCALLPPHCVTPAEPWSMVVVPLLILVPMCEVCWLTAQRLRRGIAPWTASPHHLVYWLVARGLPTPRAVASLVLLQILAVTAALWVSHSPFVVEWTGSAVIGLGCLFWGKEKWSKNEKQRLQVGASQ